MIASVLIGLGLLLLIGLLWLIVDRLDDIDTQAYRDREALSLVNMRVPRQSTFESLQKDVATHERDIGELKESTDDLFETLVINRNINKLFHERLMAVESNGTPKKSSRRAA